MTTAAAAAAVTTDELIDLVYSLPGVLAQNARFVTNRNSLSKVRKLKDGDGNYIWQPSLQAGQPAQLLGYPVTEMAAMPNIAAGAVATEDLAQKQQQLVDLANETRTSTEDTINLYRRLAIAMGEMGRSESDTLRLTELLNKAFQSSGASTQEAAAAALQLSQALASGVLQGDELRSIRENAPLLAQAIADAMGVGIGELKKLGAEGKITGRIVADAIIGAADDIETRFNATTATVGQALTILNNQLGAYIGQGDQSISATQRMAQAIIALANIRRLEREAALRQRIAEYVERYGVAGVGLAVAEQLKFDQAASEWRRGSCQDRAPSGRRGDRTSYRAVPHGRRE